MKQDDPITALLLELPEEHRELGLKLADAGARACAEGLAGSVDAAASWATREARRRVVLPAELDHLREQLRMVHQRVGEGLEVDGVERDRFRRVWRRASDGDLPLPPPPSGYQCDAEGRLMKSLTLRQRENAAQQRAVGAEFWG